MDYEPYASEEIFSLLFPGESTPSAAAFRTASRHVDSLTFNRIRAVGGLSGLTEFQKELVQEVTCRQALFEEENADAISSVLSGYAINGVSMQFGDSWNVFTDEGVAMQRDVYSMLTQTGLCCRLAR